MKKQQIIPLVTACLMLCVGIGCIVAGVIRGEAEVVLEKAVRICMECIGIG